MRAAALSKCAYLSIALGGAVAMLLGEAGHAPRALVLLAASGVGGVAPRVSPRLLANAWAVVAAVQEKQHGVPDDARAARGALLEDVLARQLSAAPARALPERVVQAAHLLQRGSPLQRLGINGGLQHRPQLLAALQDVGGHSRIFLLSKKKAAALEETTAGTLEKVAPRADL